MQIECRRRQITTGSSWWQSICAYFWRSKSTRYRLTLSIIIHDTTTGFYSYTIWLESPWPLVIAECFSGGLWCPASTLHNATAIWRFQLLQPPLVAFLWAHCPPNPAVLCFCSDDKWCGQQGRSISVCTTAISKIILFSTRPQLVTNLVKSGLRPIVIFDFYPLNWIVNGWL